MTETIISYANSQANVVIEGESGSGKELVARAVHNLSPRKHRPFISINAKLPYRSTHVLRHIGATSFYNSSGDLLALQQTGTWSNSRMPQHYAKVMNTKAKEAIERIERKSRLKVVKGGVAS